MGIFYGNFFNFYSSWLKPTGLQRGLNGFNNYMGGFPWLQNYQRGGNFSNNSIWGGFLKDRQFGGKYSNNAMWGGPGPDRQFGGKFSNNAMWGGSGNDKQFGGIFSNNYFSPGSGKNEVFTGKFANNIIKTTSDSRNRVVLGKESNNFIDATNGANSIDLSKYFGKAELALKANADDTIKYNPENDPRNFDNFTYTGNAKWEAIKLQQIS